MTQILIPAALVGVIGLIAAAVLTLSARFMGIKANEKEKDILDTLPGANCGACGYPGCEAYAKALAGGETDATSLCVPGAETAARRIAEIMGTEFGGVTKKTAFIRCRGDCTHNKEKANYNGISSCAAAVGYFGGKGACTQGCIGFGDCAAVCPEDAICIEKGIAHVDPRKCIGCGLCAKTCPNGIISLVTGEEKVYVTCSNTEKGAFTRKKCDVGCIGCMKCQRVCPTEAIKVENNLSQIDYDKCIACGKCAEVCPVQCISAK